MTDSLNASTRLLLLVFRIRDERGKYDADTGIMLDAVNALREQRDQIKLLQAKIASLEHGMEVQHGQN